MGEKEYSLKSLNILKEYGLGNIGIWRLDNSFQSTKHLKHLQGINFIITGFENASNVVYAFVVNLDVIYVGETTKGIKERFISYRYGNTNERDTDNYIKIDITEALLKKDMVSIFACQPKAILTLPKGTIEVPVSKTVEEMLIHEINPKFNKKNLGRIK